jgi:hypothetical protein
VSDAAQPSTHIEGYSVDDYMKFMGKDVTMPELQGAPDTTGTEPTATNDTANDAGTGAENYSGDTATATNGTEPLNPEMYELAGLLGAEITDTALPGIIGAMHDEPSEAFKATPEQKSKLADAWQRYLAYVEVTVSPLTYLIFQIFIVYGVNFIFGVFKWVGRLGIYGWHWPWSDSWKRSKKRAGNAAGNVAGNTPASVPNATENGHSAQHNEAVRAAQQPAQQPAPVPQPAPQAAPQQTPKQPVASPADNYRTCRQTYKLFRTGTGYPKKGSKSGDRFPELVDQFATLTAFRIYSNKNKLFGQGIAKKETEA